MVKTLQENACRYDAESLVRTNQLISRTYDDLSRLTQIATPDNTITIGYDAVGNSLSVVDNDSSVGFSYDGLNRVETTSTVDLGHQPAITLTSTYNAVGNRTQLHDTAPGTTLYAYDLAGRLTALTTPASQTITLAYDASGRLDTISFPNGVVSDYGYDTQGRLNTLTHTLGVNPSFVDFGYTYNPVGNILSIVDQVTSLQTRTFAYDALQRLKSDGTTGTPESYDYDLTGNRTTSFLSTLHTHDDANRLLEDDQFTYTYDANGNLATKTDKTTSDVTTYTWDAQDQLVQITFPDTTTATYRYDGLGRRIEKNVNGSITRYIYDGEDIVLEYDGTNTFVARYSHGQQTDQPLAVQRAGVGFFYYHADHQGSITHLTDSSGLVANSYQYDSYGRTLTVSETLPQPFTYTGREFDNESGLYYYRARYFDSQTGRFLSEDPIRFRGGDQSLYVYVFNNPVNFGDPSGLQRSRREARNAEMFMGFQEGLTGKDNPTPSAPGLRRFREGGRAMGKAANELVEQLMGRTDEQLANPKSNSSDSGTGDCDSNPESIDQFDPIEPTPSFDPFADFPPSPISSPPVSPILLPLGFF